MSDDPVLHDGDATDRGRARVPGLVRAPALRAGGEVRALRRRRQRASRIQPCWTLPACAAGRLPVQSLRQRSADPGGARVRAALDRPRVPRVAVTPIVGGQAIKGPAAKMLAELGHDVSALGVARYYRDWVDGFVLDAADAALAPRIARGHAGSGGRHRRRNDQDERGLAAGPRIRGRTRHSGRHSEVCRLPSFR